MSSRKTAMRCSVGIFTMKANRSSMIVVKNLYVRAFQGCAGGGERKRVGRESGGDAGG
jgi:hypothetical protein